LPLASYAADGEGQVSITVQVNGTFSVYSFGAGGFSGTTSGGSVTLRPTIGTPDTSGSAGARIVSNIHGSYNMYIGTPPGGTNTTRLYSIHADPTNTSLDTDTYAIVPVTDSGSGSASLSTSTAQWGYKFNGACNATVDTGLTPNCGTTANLQGAKNNDTNWRAPTKFAAGFGSGGRILSEGANIPNDKGDDYLISVGASISSKTVSEQFTGSLIFYAATSS
jgi:hypothetical protein